MEDPQHRNEVNLDTSEEHAAYTPRRYEVSMHCSVSEVVTQGNQDNFTELEMDIKDSTKAATAGV